MIRSFIFFLMLPSVGFANEPVLSEAWKLWRETYSSSSPYRALQKTRQGNLKMQDEHLIQILKGNSKLQFQAPLKLNKNEVTEFDVTQMDQARRFETTTMFDLQGIEPHLSKKEVFEELGRFRQMRENMQSLILNREDDELLIIFAGETHGLDLFFGSYLKPDLRPSSAEYKIRSDVEYVGMVANENTEFFTALHDEFYEALRGSRMESEKLGDFSAIDYASFFARLHYYNSLKSGLLKKDMITKDERTPFPKALVFLDVHHLRSPQVFHQMPEARDLLKAGFRKIKVAMEGWKFGKSYNSSDLKRFYYMDTSSYLSKDDLEYYKKFRKKAFQLLENGFVVNANIEAFHRRLRSYEERGIPIDYTGLEPRERL